MKNGLKKFFAVSAVGLAGATMLTGCSITDEQLSTVEGIVDEKVEQLIEELKDQNQDLVDVLGQDKTPAELIEWLNNENEKVVKEKALELLIDASQRIDDRLGFNKAHTSQKIYSGTSYTEIEHKILNNDYSDRQMYIIEDIENNCEYYMAEGTGDDSWVTFNKYDFANDYEYKYYSNIDSIDVTTGTTYGYSAINNLLTICKRTFNIDLGTEHIKSVTVNQDGSIAISIEAQGYFVSKDNHGGETRYYSYSGSIAGDYVIKDGKIMWQDYYITQQGYGYTTIEPNKDVNGEYIANISSSFDVRRVERQINTYYYDDEVDMTRFNEVKALAEAKYLES